MVDMGFRKKEFWSSDTHSKGGVSVILVREDGVEKLIVTTDNPRQYITVPTKLIEKCHEDLWNADASNAMALRGK